MAIYLLRQTPANYAVQSGGKDMSSSLGPHPMKTTPLRSTLRKSDRNDLW